MAIGSDPLTEADEAKNLAQAWDDLRADPDIQYAPVEWPEQEPPPDWLISLQEFLADLFAPVWSFAANNWTVIWIILAALGIALFLYILWRIYGPALLARKTRTKGNPQEEEWVPETGEAIALLKDADALAAQGHYDEATHLLLGRSVAQINTARPDLIEPSSTAREIAALPDLPSAASHAFKTIAERVERSLFALHALGQEDWTIARAAYADFAKVGTQFNAQTAAQTNIGAAE